MAIFGLNELSVRLPSIIAGSLLPLLFFLLIKKIFPKNDKFALIAALLLALNPWNIHFSRGAWETNLLLLELVLACLLFLNKRFLLSAIFMGLGLYTYQAAKLLVPLISLLLIIQTRKFTKSYFVTLFILAIPAIYGLVFGSDSNRLKVMSLFSYHRPQTEINQIIAESNPLDYRLLFPPHFLFQKLSYPLF